MADPELIPIGAFARRSGLTASALRFYDDVGLLRPASVDGSSGYRYYAPDQLERAIAVRRLRSLEMPLPTVERVLADPADAARMIDEHVAGLSARAEDARRAAVEIKAALTGASAIPLATVKGPVLAAAVDQVLAATGEAEEFPVISGVHVEIAGEAVTLTATDRFRLSTRTLVPDSVTGSWVGTLDGTELRSALVRLRRAHRVSLEALPDALRCRFAEGEVSVHVAAGQFPDHRAMTENLPSPRTRIVVAKAALLAELEDVADETVRLNAEPGRLTLTPAANAEAPVSASDADAGASVPVSVDAVVDGPEVELWFAVPVLHPAVATAIGPDLLLDVRSPVEPVTVRSADNGTLTTQAMPVEPR
ncbi:hypothetical protein BJF85_13860 [Saccharomonospora sp. CUA-673]|uniref:DNA polymerase III subunit beta family protein n=1 Tax=Saccharomonospora sp. CUA-673 TaxID=1904969 RepID=UPI00096202BD|nr:MerR family transcriptional regulator [Saccharomonospora sp. CUA-673]OLT47973.1 hypothetical protein BJF85_13860 [Saccharomonospora sp. CUA-673]